MLKVHRSYLFSSNPANGAQNVSVDGDRFSVSMNEPLRIPKDAIHAYLTVPTAKIWWTVPNISEWIGNDQLYLTTDWADPITGAPAGSPNFQFTIPKGLYSVTALNVAIQRELGNAGLPNDLLVIGGDDASQKATITFNTGAYTAQLDMTQADTFRDILGFNSRLVPLAPASDGFIQIADNPAEFNSITSFLVSSDLVSTGIPVNSVGGGVISNPSINVKPGSQIIYEPYNPLEVDASELIGKSKGNFTFALTDQQRRAVDTNGEYWDFQLVLSYCIPIKNEKLLKDHSGSWS